MNRSDRWTTLLLTVASPVLAVIAFSSLQQDGLTADTSLWVFLLLVSACGILNASAASYLARHPRSVPAMHFRSVVTVLGTAVVTYSAGWGSLLAVAFLVGGSEMVRAAGAAALWPTHCYTLAAVLIAEIGVELGWVPSVLSPGLSHAIAITAMCCATLCVSALRRASTAAEKAEALLVRRAAHFGALIEHASDIFGEVCSEGVILYVSPATQEVLGVSAAEVMNQSILEYLHPEHHAVALAALAEPIEAGQQTQSTLRLRHRDGSERVMLATLTRPHASENFIINLRDITTQHRYEKRLRHEANHDVLTGLLNRKAFSFALEGLGDCSGAEISMLYIDLDGFKTVNDTLGHDIGDEVLQITARRLERCVRRADVVARLGGDEFGVLLPAAGTALAIVVAERILAEVSRPIPSLPVGMTVGASIGIATRSAGGIEMGTLIREADEAMYCAKRSGRARWRRNGDSTPDHVPSSTEDNRGAVHS